MQVALLGPLRLANGDGAVVELGGARLRMLLARLALDAGRVVPTAALIDGLWGEDPPADATNALQSLVSRLRRGLRPEADGLVESHPTGYRLLVSQDDVDVHRFERLAAQGRAALTDGRLAEATDKLRTALDLWHGPALAGLDDAPFAAGAVTRLSELRAAAVEDRLDADVRSGRHTEVIAELRTLVAEQPLRERPAALLVRALFLAGRQADALAVYERVRATLADELGVEPSPELRDLHLAVLRGEIEAPPTRHVTAALTSFVGRRAELAEVSRLLGGTRLVTLVGPGGAGKTRLSTEVVAAQDGQSWFVELAGVRATDDVPAAALAALGVRETRLMDNPGTGPRVSNALDRLADVLGTQRCVLVLDNCEHLIEAAATLADSLLARCPRLRVLATSREPLAITGEVVFPVGPLGLPADDAPAAEVAGTEAVRLFADRAESAAPGFRVDGDHAATVAEICRRLDGLPLALELAAARLRSMTVGQIAERLDDRFRLLTGGSRTSLPRHRTLRAVVEWSWDLLEKPERVLAARLSMFPAAATAEAVAAVAADDDLLPAADVVYVLASLVEKSIVVAAEGRDGQVRYRMLETVRAYAAERHAESGETERVRDRYCRYFLAFLQEAEPHLRGPEQVGWLARITADHENMLAAVRHAIGAADADLAHRLAVGATWFWMVAGQQREAMKVVTEVVALPGPAPAHARATLRALAAFAEAGGIPDREVVRELRADLAATDAISHYPMMAMVEPLLAAFSGDMADALANVARMIDHPDPWARALALLGQAFLQENQGDLAEAEVAVEAALTRFRELGDRWGQAMAIGQVSERRSLRGDHVGAIEANEEAVRLVSELGAVDELPGSLGRLAIQRGRAGDLAGAERDAREALRIAERSGNVENRAVLLAWLSTILRQRGDLPAARAVLNAGEAALTALPGRPPHWLTLYATAGAQLSIAEGHPEFALSALSEALAAIASIPDMPIAGTLGEVTAQVLFARGDAMGAARLLGVAAAVRGAPDLGNPELVELTSKMDELLGADGRVAAYESGMALPRTAALAELSRILGN
ncbi:BTAD domain-containing putative transcriptional regulator [Actinokineospora sp. NBRC 105648]|uniref:BTAD domain-containing putative transcriptional regulator n=1 Tax=Actinokineospora sp. NBRC 105648 TaxID=3032206 RepID=UPI002556F84D|nr:BTAD domain-containing putative transcriptional regulator [Actinokineospora sp. NBRC 105648]